MKLRSFAAATGSLCAALLCATALAQDATQAPADSQALETIVVTGSHIPRAEVEGPAPVTVITAEEIRRNGFVSVPDVMRSLNQNTGETQGQQSNGGFTPGAQQVDLRGLGPNHTLVLINGHRIADYPYPYQSESNFTDISSIPLSMIDRIEVLSGSASAVYGSDAISGVVNFILKKKADGTTIDYRYGDTQHGGGQSQRLQLTTGWSAGDFDSIVSLELLDQKPLWAYDRGIQDSTADNRTTDGPLARRTFLRVDEDGNYVDPGRDTCASLAGLNGGTTYYASRNRYGSDGGPGYFCGSNESIGYGTVEHQKRAANLAASLNYHLADHVELFAQLMGGYANTQLYNDVLQWNYQNAAGDPDELFYNQHTGALDDWYRQFTPEESGGLRNGMIKLIDHTYSVVAGVKGAFGESGWEYEAYFNHSQFISKNHSPEVLAAKANAFFLGPQLGVDPDSGYPIFNADPARLYTPLTPAELASISQYSTDTAHTRTENYAININQNELFNLPAGPVGFAALGEFGNQAYAIDVDPNYLDHSYYFHNDTGGAGSRAHWALGYELRAPILSSLTASTAGRYDNYDYSGNGGGKFTYNFGLEWRPFDSLLVRGSSGTGFRAPDLHYLYAGPSGFHSSGNDYYLCRTQQPDVDIGDCDYADSSLLGRKHGNRALNNETSTSLTAGFVFSPGANFDVSVDYFRVHLKNEVEDLDIDGILRAEADCRIGTTQAGTPVDVNSPSCLDAISRVSRYPAGNPHAGELISVFVNPVNVASERTDGIDLAAHYKMEIGRAGLLNFNLGYTRVFSHKFQRFAGDPTLDEFLPYNAFDIPRTKANASVGWTLGAFTTTLYGQRLGGLPNYDEDNRLGPSFLYNASLVWRIDERAQLTFVVDNLLDKKPHKDVSYASYPYYDISWFDPVGRQFFVELNYRFGGK